MGREAGEGCRGRASRPWVGLSGGSHRTAALAAVRTLCGAPAPVTPPMPHPPPSAAPPTQALASAPAAGASCCPQSGCQRRGRWRGAALAPADSESESWGPFAGLERRAGPGAGPEARAGDCRSRLCSAGKVPGQRSVCQLGCTAVAHGDAKSASRCGGNASRTCSTDFISSTSLRCTCARAACGRSCDGGHGQIGGRRRAAPPPPAPTRAAGPPWDSWRCLAARHQPRDAKKPPRC